GGRPVVGDVLGLQVPHLGEFLHVPGVLPVAEARQVAVRAALPGVLGGGLAVHLEQSAAGSAEHAADQVQVVDLDGRRGGRVGLVDALEDGGHQPAGAAEDLRGPLDLGGRDVADLGGPPGGALLDGGGEVVEADGVRVEVGAVGPAG